MAKKIKYTVYMQNRSEMFDITNTSEGYVCFSASEEGAKNPPIKMTLVDSSKDLLRQIISIDAVSDDLAEREDDPALMEECIDALLGESFNWKLTTVIMSIDTIGFIVVDNRQHFVDIGIGPSFVGHFTKNLRMAFDVARYGAPPERYEVEYSAWQAKGNELETYFRIVEYRNGYKYRRYEFGSHSLNANGLGHPCQIEEY